MRNVIAMHYAVAPAAWPEIDEQQDDMTRVDVRVPEMEDQVTAAQIEELN